MANRPYLKVGYGLSEALPSIFPSPIVAKRAPTANDTGYQLGQIWIFSASNAAYILTSVVAGVASWNLLEAGGGAGAFASLVVTPGPTSITGVTAINTTGAGVTSINTGGTGALNLGNATGNTNVTGALSASTTLTAGTGLIATSGNITASTGNLVLSAAGGKLVISAAANGSVGTSVAMTAGSVTVATTAVTAVSKIFLTANTPGGTQGTLSAPTASIVPGVSFVINSSSGTDTSTVNWVLIN